MSAVGAVDESVLLNDLVNPNQTGGLAVRTAEPNLVDALNGSVRSGRFLDDTLAQVPATVLGSVAAERLGVRTLDGTQVLIGGEWFAVVGILNSFDDQSDDVDTALFEDLDRTAFVGFEVANQLFDCLLYTSDAADE